MKYNKNNKNYLGLLNFEGDVFRAYDEGNGTFTVVDEDMNYVITTTALGIRKIMEGKLHLTSSSGRVYDLSIEHINAKPSRSDLYKFLKIERPSREVAIEFATWMRNKVGYEAVVDGYVYGGRVYDSIDQLYDVYSNVSGN
jgi:hypothetical protein